jgi:hypothetical protein
MSTPSSYYLARIGSQAGAADRKAARALDASQALGWMSPRWHQIAGLARASPSTLRWRQ